MLTDLMTSLVSLVVTVHVKNPSTSLIVSVLILIKVTVRANVNLLMTTMWLNGNYAMMEMLVNTTLMVPSFHNALLKLVTKWSTSG